MSSHSNRCAEGDHDVARVNNEEGFASSATDSRIRAHPEPPKQMIDDFDTDLVTTCKRYPTAVAWSAFFSVTLGISMKDLTSFLPLGKQA